MSSNDLNALLELKQNRPNVLHGCIVFKSNSLIYESTIFVIPKAFDLIS